jgi:hypothetical protein
MTADLPFFENDKSFIFSVILTIYDTLLLVEYVSNHHFCVCLTACMYVSSVSNGQTYGVDVRIFNPDTVTLVLKYHRF